MVEGGSVPARWKARLVHADEEHNLVVKPRYFTSLRVTKKEQIMSEIMKAFKRSGEIRTHGACMLGRRFTN